VRNTVAGAHHPRAKRELTAGELEARRIQDEQDIRLDVRERELLEDQGAEGVAQVVEAQVLDVGGPKRGGRPSCTTDRSADAARTLSSSAMRRGRCPTRSSPRLACAGRGCGVRPAARRQADRSGAWTLATSHDIPPASPSRRAAEPGRPCC
jgi:hypothetical protein